MIENIYIRSNRRDQTFFEAKFQKLEGLLPFQEGIVINGVPGSTYGLLLCDPTRWTMRDTPVNGSDMQVVHLDSRSGFYAQLDKVDPTGEIFSVEIYDSPKRRESGSTSHQS